MNFRKPKEDRIRARAAMRLRAVPQNQAMNWMESAITSFHQNLDMYRLHNDHTALEECRKAISMIAGGMDVLEERKQD